MKWARLACQGAQMIACLHRPVARIVSTQHPAPACFEVGSGIKLGSSCLHGKPFADQIVTRVYNIDTFIFFPLSLDWSHLKFNNNLYV